MFDDFTLDERRAVLLIEEFEHQAERLYNRYRNLDLTRVKSHPAFGQFVTVAKWIQEKVGDLAWTEQL
ncbi:MAG: hypothetical protein QXG97_05765, partial [Nitrososphaerota archaeon]